MSTQKTGDEQARGRAVEEFLGERFGGVDVGEGNSKEQSHVQIDRDGVKSGV